MVSMRFNREDSGGGGRAEVPDLAASVSNPATAETAAVGATPVGEVIIRETVTVEAIIEEEVVMAK